MVRRAGILSDFRELEQRRSGVRVASHCIDARQNGARIIVADRLDLCGGDHAIVPRSQRGKTRQVEQYVAAIISR